MSLKTFYPKSGPYLTLRQAKKRPYRANMEAEYFSESKRGPGKRRNSLRYYYDVIVGLIRAAPFVTIIKI
jgi:hypothetical protein